MSGLLVQWLRALYVDSVRGAAFSSGVDLDAAEVRDIVFAAKAADVVTLPVSAPVAARRAA